MRTVQQHMHKGSITNESTIVFQCVFFLKTLNKEIKNTKIYSVFFLPDDLTNARLDWKFTGNFFSTKRSVFFAKKIYTFLRSDYDLYIVQ